MFSEGFLAYAKQRKSLLFLCIAALGVIIVAVSALPISRGTGSSYGSGEQSLEEYKASLEKELSELCSEAYGVGRCIVSVSFDGGWRSEYKGSTLISRTPPKVAGITVLCEGAGSVEVRRELSELLSALFGVGQNRICVLKLSS